LLLPRFGPDGAVRRLADGGAKGNQVCSYPDTPERLGVNAGLRRPLPSDRSDRHHAAIPAFLEDPAHDIQGLGLFPWCEQKFVQPLPCFVQGF